VATKKRGPPWKHRIRTNETPTKKDNLKNNIYAKKNIKICHFINALGADENTLNDMTEDQIETYLYGAEILTEDRIPREQMDIRQHFPCKDKSELNPGEEVNQLTS
jgi:hypothetical protein